MLKILISKCLMRLLMLLVNHFVIQATLFGCKMPYDTQQHKTGHCLGSFIAVFWGLGFFFKVFYSKSWDITRMKPFGGEGQTSN